MSGGASLAIEARELIAASTQGILCTLLPGNGEPYGSLVEVLPLSGGDVVMFLSALAEHRKNLEADPRASVLLAPALGAPDALTRPRVTVVGRAERVGDRGAHRDAYLARHSASAAFIDFPDFAFYRLRVERARYIAGFGRMGWVRRDALADDAGPG